MIRIQEAKVRMAVEGPRDELDLIDEDLRYRPDGYLFAPSYERWRLTGGSQGWDGYVRPLKRLDATHATLLRGYRDTLLASCQTHRIDVDGSGLYPRPFANLTLADIPDDLVRAPFALDEHQRTAILSWLHHGIGINQMSVGAGKTATFAGAARILKNQYHDACILYLTPAERLVRQVTHEMRQFLPGFDVGQFGGGKDQRDARDMVVCTVAMLRRHLKVLVREGFFRRFMGLFYDECHHAASASSETICCLVPAFFRFGATDSAQKTNVDRRNRMIGLFGSILNYVPAAPLIARGRLARPHLYIQGLEPWADKFRDVPLRAVPNTPAWCLVEGAWQRATYLGPVLRTDADGQTVMRRRLDLVFSEEHGRWKNVVQETPEVESGLHRLELDGTEVHVESRWVLLHRLYDEALVRFKARNDLVGRWSAHFSAQGFPTLVVCTRTLHIYLLEAAIKSLVNPDLVKICFGWATPLQRDEVLTWFRNTPGSILISPLIKEGVSIHEIRAGVVADYVGNVETANQIIGRFMRRKTEGANIAEIVWFREAQHPTLRRGSTRLIHQLGANYGYPIQDPAPALPPRPKAT